MDRPLDCVQLMGRKVPAGKEDPKGMNPGTHYQEPPHAKPKAMAQCSFVNLQVILWGAPWILKN